MGWTDSDLLPVVKEGRTKTKSKENAAGEQVANKGKKAGTESWKSRVECQPPSLHPQSLRPAAVAWGAPTPTPGGKQGTVHSRARPSGLTFIQRSIALFKIACSIKQNQRNRILKENYLFAFFFFFGPGSLGTTLQHGGGKQKSKQRIGGPMEMWRSRLDFQAAEAPWIFGGQGNRERRAMQKGVSKSLQRDPKRAECPWARWVYPKLSTEGLRGWEKNRNEQAGRDWSHSGENSLTEIYPVNVTEPRGVQTSNWSNIILGVSGSLFLDKINIWICRLTALIGMALLQLAEKRRKRPLPQLRERSCPTALS